MKPWIRNLLAVLGILVGFGVWGLIESNLSLPPPPKFDVPQANPPADMSVAAVLTGEMEARALLAYRGGSPFEVRKFAMGVFVVRHPRGTLLFDAGFGSRIDAHVMTINAVSRSMASYTRGTPLAQQLAAAGIEPGEIRAIVLTHAHWDHVSGLDDLRDVPVWLSQPEREFVRDGGEPTALIRGFGELKYEIIEYPDGPYLGFEKSRDVWGDGSVVLTHAPGHTPGSLIAFITLPGQQRYALVGDLVWQKEGIEYPAERPWISRLLVDWDAERVRQAIVHLHHVTRRIPSMVVVPAHDARVWSTLPKL